ncbi:RNA polymerase sigma-70 factor [Pedobacter nyackensis]|uniref:RNA polymerase sigma-70 factor, ECF subfamily n=1 Tax=Pedobacter nyackensis TaxID=475255 RepID=A0A1W2DKN3_9SPHI|nr:RNA polymerase sigma-70 factor [Pedobacter nyackensis]SMC98029.1 RNA polymerase sigma-70 factor, ECF subfamily [Pedobacter nyackensis]
METASITNRAPIDMGNEDAFEEMYRSYFAPLCYFARKYIDQEDAEDVINNLFLKLWRQKELFESIQHAQSALYVATRNSCLDFLKIAKRAEDRHILVAKGAAPDADFIEQMIRTEVWAEIYREINKLPVQCSKVISLSFVEGLKNDEIARELDISIQTVKNQKSMGVKLLKQKLSKSGFLLLCMYM